MNASLERYASRGSLLLYERPVAINELSEVEADASTRGVPPQAVCAVEEVVLRAFPCSNSHHLCTHNNFTHQPLLSVYGHGGDAISLQCRPCAYVTMSGCAVMTARRHIRSVKSTFVRGGEELNERSI